MLEKNCIMIIYNYIVRRHKGIHIDNYHFHIGIVRMISLISEQKKKK